MANAVETYNEDGQWKNRVQTNSRASAVFDTKAEAVEAGKEQAKNLHTEHVIKKLDGTIQNRNSYGNDPYPPKG